MKKLTVADFFCGAGGFSEGFRQQGFTIVFGLDCWQPAIDTFNHNFNLNMKSRNILDFEGPVEMIEALPNTDVILGSPPCVSFSSSNKAGKADKSLGVRLTIVFLRIVAVKKFTPTSILKAWYMENVPNSIKFLQDKYTFSDLNLEDWAVKNGMLAHDTAINLKGNQHVNSAAEYGAPQVRKRLLSGEIVHLKELKIPTPTHNLKGMYPGGIPPITLGDVLKTLPQPHKSKTKKFNDPLYPSLALYSDQLTDHFYDTGIYKVEWENSRYQKQNHPYFGKMAFPEDESRPSRTVTATRIGHSRESLIFPSGYKRKGDGEYRVPTAREAACLMGFPITYQFIGSEGTKWTLIGNSVCPPVSAAYARHLRSLLKLKKIEWPKVCFEQNTNGVPDLNTYKEKVFGQPTPRNENARFRRHPFKHGFMTVTLSNYDIMTNSKYKGKWHITVQYGNGVGFPCYEFTDNYYKKITHIIKNIPKGGEFLSAFQEYIEPHVPSASIMQKVYENRYSSNGFLGPIEVVSTIAEIIESLNVSKITYHQDDKMVIFPNRFHVPVSQVFALWALSRVKTLLVKKTRLKTQMEVLV